MKNVTAIGPYAYVHKSGDFGVTIREDGECLTISEDPLNSTWIGEMSLKQAATGAALTLVGHLWRPSVSDAFRAVVLTRLYDRMDHYARAASLKEVVGADKVLEGWASGFDPDDDDAAPRAVPLLLAFDGMTEQERRQALETLIVVGLDAQRLLGRSR